MEKLPIPFFRKPLKPSDKHRGEKRTNHESYFGHRPMPQARGGDYCGDIGLNKIIFRRNHVHGVKIVKNRMIIGGSK
jgi:hypothetical protein